jgi:DNA sulfur modification protein DndD
MHFTEIRLVNFGQFNGEHTINLQPSSEDISTNERPIILIGGKNGAGKTTLLEAVKLCLYGPAALGYGVRQQEYEEYLLSRIHRQLGSPLQNMFAGVALSFVHTVNGVVQSFEVQRSWERKRRGIDEICEVRRNGIPLDKNEFAGWEQFLYDLLPPGLANLFFFDGEQIQALADDPNHTVLGTSIRALFGIDLINRLRGDLSVYVARQKRANNGGLEAQLEAIKAERELITESFDQAFVKLSSIRRELQQKQGKLEEQERLLASEGGNIVRERDALRLRTETLRADLRRYERVISEYAASLLPFAVIPSLSLQLRDRLLNEEQIDQKRMMQQATEEFSQAFFARITDYNLNDSLSLKAHQYNTLLDEISRLLEDTQKAVVGSATDHNSQLLHDLSKTERYEMVTWIDQATSELPSSLADLANSIEATTSELAQIETSLQQIPAEETLQPILQRLAVIQRELGALEEQQRQQEAVVEQWRQKREELRRREEELYTRLMRGDDPTYRIQLAGRAQQALKKYEEALQRAKIEELQQKIVECFSRLSRKGNYIRRIAINPQTFETILYNHKGDALPKEQLSAGEKQIYAVAVLWALRLVSKRSLPIIIDTPLGRLDSEHRQRLVERYFPQASHQVVLLSTDTEIDQELFDALEPATSRIYQLLYQPSEATTKVVEGYFWEMPVSPEEKRTTL